MKKYKLLVAAALAVMVGALALPLAAHAGSNIRSGTTASVGKDEVIDATVYLAGSTVTVAGDVQGDLYCAGQTVNITGTVEGDVICAGQSVTVSGKVLGNVRVAGQTVTITSPIARSLTAFGQTVTVDNGSVVNADATVFGNVVQLNGRVNRDATVGGQAVTIDGTIGRNTTAVDTELTLTRSARLGGTLEYTSRNEVKRDGGAVVGGKVQRHEPQTHDQRVRNGFVDRFWGIMYWFAAFLVFGLAVLAFAPRTYKKTSTLMMKQGGWALLAGVVTLVMAPIVSIMLIVTLIGLPVGVALFMLWIIALVAAYVYSSYTVGQWVAAQASWNLKWPVFSSLVLGLVILALIMMVPIVGSLFAFLALVWGLGGIVLLSGQYIRHRSEEGTAKKAKA